jgi:hypothetical protein
MNGTSGRFKDKNKRSNCRKLFSFITRKNVHFRSFEVCINMSVEGTIEKLQRLAREKEAQRSEHKQR